MPKLALALLAALTLALTACAVEPDSVAASDEAPAPFDPDTAPVPEEVATPSPEDEGEGESDELPPELLLVPPVPATCTPTTQCAGVKTCGAWTPFTACGANFTACDPTCAEASSFGRAGCNYLGTFTPQNRTRTCVIRATGATCIETGYLARKLMCTPVDF